MRRKEKEIKDKAALNKIIEQCEVCRLGLSHNNVPYIVPLSFGYDGRTLYFHTAAEGKKIDILAINNRVCFEFETGVRIVPHDTKPCKWSFSFQSVIGLGTAGELLSAEEKIHGLTWIMAQYGDAQWDFTDIPLQGVRVWAVSIEEMTGKQSLD